MENILAQLTTDGKIAIWAIVVSVAIAISGGLAKCFWPKKGKGSSPTQISSGDVPIGVGKIKGNVTIQIYTNPHKSSKTDHNQLKKPEQSVAELKECS